MFVRPDGPVPKFVNFDATQGSQYLDTLLYTDDIDQVTADGRIVINGRRSRNIKANGIFIGTDELERTIGNAFAGSVVAYKLVQSEQRVIHFWTGGSTENRVFKTARGVLKNQLGDNIAIVISSTCRIEEMPYNASYKIDVARPMDVTHEVTRLVKSTSLVPTDVALILAGPNSITTTQLHFWLQSSFDYEEDMRKLFEEDCTADSLALLIVENATATPWGRFR